MKRSRSPRDLWASLLPTLGALLALAMAVRTPALEAEELMPPALLLVLILAGAAASCHRPFRAVSTVGLGTLVLPLACAAVGGLPAAGLAASSFLSAELLLRLVHRATVYGAPDRRSLMRSLESAGRAVLATLAAGLAWVVFPRGTPLATIAATAGFTYLLFWTGLEVADGKIRRPEQPVSSRWKTLLPPLALDAFGWSVGSVLIAVRRTSGWTLTGLLIAALACLALEAARNRVLHERSHHRAFDLERLRRAGKRMVDKGEREIVDVIDRIKVECGKVVEFCWFQLELLAQGSEFKSWWAGPKGPESELRLGVPEPDRYAPVLPGVHRRAQWTILERPLRVDGKLLGRLRLWCDPRRLDPQGVELLERLVPQMSASVARCLAGREAREDALTGAVLRRVLEKKLHEVHARVRDEGGDMAVILCDLDHFKKINDTYGHPAGDAALVAAAGVLKTTHEGALCCRYGGEEFVLLIEGMEGGAALALAEQLRRNIEELPFEHEGQRIPLTMSAGVASYPDILAKTAAELILFADEALYEAKRRGRNRVLLDVGQGRYQDVEGTVFQSEETPKASEPPRIFV
ncbi:MAG TPA: GGDEF domain-containing protein [Thermoanaerobaculia bacterium]|nr:GGDEF domain-containing protein [Thermoanaerobaculia bacterium]